MKKTEIPIIEYYKKQAKSLFKSFKANETSAVERVYKVPLNHRNLTHESIKLGHMLNIIAYEQLALSPSDKVPASLWSIFKAKLMAEYLREQN